MIDAHFGPASEAPEWDDPRFIDEVDDDAELAVTPADVVGILGFDPKEFSEKKDEFSEWAKTANPENVKLLRDSIAAKILIGKDKIRKRWNL